MTVMNSLLADLVKVLDLEQIEVNIFRGESRDIGSPQVFGGQVLGQAVIAASRTVEQRELHSLHAYFLRRGDVNADIVYDVDRARDGRSFSNRRVVAIQHGRPIFNMTASFQIQEEGLEHQIPAPEVPDVDELPEISIELAADGAKLPKRFAAMLKHRRPFHLRLVPDAAQGMGTRYMWMRAIDALPDDPPLHRALLAYMSDYGLLGAATIPHGENLGRGGELQMASIDHTIWFHRPARVDEWLLFALDSPSASGARGLARSSVFTRDGALVASNAQEGLIRQR